MNKWFLLVFVAVSGMGGCAAGDTEWRTKIALQCNAQAAYRTLASAETWKGSRWAVSGGNYPAVGLKRVGGDGPLSTVSVITVGTNDSIQLSWIKKGGEEAGADSMLKRLAGFLSKPSNVYGMDVSKIMWKDSVLLVTELSTAAYPSVKELYNKIDSLRAYIAHQGRKETDPPMLNVVHTRLTYKSTIAVPLDKEVEPTEAFAVQRFVPWKVMTGVVNGGAMTAERAMDQLRLYVLDYQLTAMAMPFQSLETERDKEPDTTKWVTRVVVPVP